MDGCTLPLTTKVQVRFLWPHNKTCLDTLIHTKKKAKKTKKGGDGVMLGNQVLPSSQNLDGAKQ